MALAASIDSQRGYFDEPHPPQDNELNRNRGIRYFIFVVCLILAIAAPLWLCRYLGFFFEVPNLGTIVGVAAVAFLVRILIWRGVVYNPEYMAYVTQNPFTGDMIPYGPGLHFSLPWEERNKKGKYPLEVRSKSFEISVQTKSAATKTPGEFSYAINLPRILTAISIDEGTHTATVETFLKSVIGSYQAGFEANEVLGMTDEINQKLADKNTPEGIGEKIRKFGETFGLKIVRVVTGNAKLGQEAQTTRDALDEAERMFGIVARMNGMSERALRKKLKNGEISKKEYDKMLNKAMGISENATVSVQVVDSDVPVILGVGAGTQGKKQHGGG